MSPKPSFDATIPVLTEVFQNLPAKAGAGATAASAEGDVAALERRLCERIVEQLQGQVGAMLEQRLRDSLEQALQQALHHALAGPTDALRASLRKDIEDIVGRAVAQELAHLHLLKK